MSGPDVEGVMARLRDDFHAARRARNRAAIAHIWSEIRRRTDAMNAFAAHWNAISCDSRERPTASVGGRR